MTEQPRLASAFVDDSGSLLGLPFGNVIVINKFELHDFFIVLARVQRVEREVSELHRPVAVAELVKSNLFPHRLESLSATSHLASTL